MYQYFTHWNQNTSSQNTHLSLEIQMKKYSFLFELNIFLLKILPAKLLEFYSSLYIFFRNNVQVSVNVKEEESCLPYKWWEWIPTQREVIALECLTVILYGLWSLVNVYYWYAGCPNITRQMQSFPMLCVLSEIYVL